MLVLLKISSIILLGDVPVEEASSELTKVPKEDALKQK